MVFSAYQERKKSLKHPDEHINFQFEGIILKFSLFFSRSEESYTSREKYPRNGKLVAEWKSYVCPCFLSLGEDAREGPTQIVCWF